MLSPAVNPINGVDEKAIVERRVNVLTSNPTLMTRMIVSKRRPFLIIRSLKIKKESMDKVRKV